MSWIRRRQTIYTRLDGRRNFNEKRVFTQGDIQQKNSPHADVSGQYPQHFHYSSVPINHQTQI